MSLNPPKIKLTRSRLAMAVSAAVLVAPATAYASHVFDDVPDDKFYAGPVEWAFENGITTGKTATAFAPDDPVTRGESVTFLQRYHDNIVVDGQGRVAGDRTDDNVDNWNGDPVSRTTTITAPTAGYLVVDYAATVTSDVGETATGQTSIVANLTVDGDQVADTVGGVSFDAPWQTNFNTMQMSTVVPVAAGEHTVVGTVQRGIPLPAGGLLFIYDQHVSAMFVPLGGDGTAPS